MTSVVKFQELNSSANVIKNLIHVMNVLLFTLMIAIINQIVKVKYISQKLLLKRFNSFITADFRFGFSFDFRYGSYV